MFVCVFLFCVCVLVLFFVLCWFSFLTFWIRGILKELLSRLSVISSSCPPALILPLGACACARPGGQSVGQEVWSDARTARRSVGKSGVGSEGRAVGRSISRLVSPQQKNGSQPQLWKKASSKNSSGARSA